MRKVGGLAGDLALDELLDEVAGVVVVVLLRRRLHEVGRCRENRAADATVLGDLCGAYGVDDDARRVRGVPDFELVLEVQRYVAKGSTFQPYICPLPVVQP